MSQVFDLQEQESKFQEVFEKVNQINYSASQPVIHFNESDLRVVFCAGMDFERNKNIIIVGKNE